MKTPATTIRRFILPGIFLLMLLPFSILAQDKVKILYVSDGDTFHALTERGEKLKIRLSDVDCPESSQTFGLEAKVFSVTAILGKEVIIKISDTDRYGRKIARVVYDDKDLSEELVRNGFAWHYKSIQKMNCSLN